MNVQFTSLESYFMVFMEQGVQFIIRKLDINRFCKNNQILLFVLSKIVNMICTEWIVKYYLYLLNLLLRFSINRKTYPYSIYCIRQEPISYISWKASYNSKSEKVIGRVVIEWSKTRRIINTQNHWITTTIFWEETGFQGNFKTKNVIYFLKENWVLEKFHHAIRFVIVIL